MSLNVVFMGTPSFAAASLEAIVKAGYAVQAVVTQPDRPKGRGYALAASPVKLAAEAFGLPVLQPESIAEPSFLAELNAMAPDVILVVAFGQKVPLSILALPKHGCINVHGSLLPKYRGAAPIQRAIIDGETTTGVTTMYMAEGWDTGDMILKRSVDIAPSETAGELHDKLASAGAELLVETLMRIEQGTAPRVPQNDAEATYAHKVSRDEAEIQWERPASAICNLVRGLSPSPSAYTRLAGQLLKVIKADPLASLPSEVAAKHGALAANRPGLVLSGTNPDGIYVAAGEGVVLLRIVQAEGAKALPAAEFARGRRLSAGELFGREQG